MGGWMERLVQALVQVRNFQQVNYCKINYKKFTQLLANFLKSTNDKTISFLTGIIVFFQKVTKQLNIFKKKPQMTKNEEKNTS